MVSIETAIEEFPQTIERYSSHSDMDELEMITNGIEQLIYQNPTAYDEKSVSRYLNQRAATLKNMVEEYFSASIAQKFPLLSDDLFGLKRYIVLKSEGRKWKIIDDGTLPNKIDFTIPQKPIKPLNPKRKSKVSSNRYNEELKIYNQEIKEWNEEKKKIISNKNKTKFVEIPLFAYTPLFDGKHTANLGKFTIQKDYRLSKVTIEAKLPGIIGSNLKDAYRDALSHYFGVLCRMFTNPVAGDIMYADGNLIKPQIGAIWIPTPESLNISLEQRVIEPRKNLDPAMILRVRGKNYLVQTWRVDDEEPFENYIREYSIGDLKDKLD